MTWCERIKAELNKLDSGEADLWPSTTTDDAPLYLRNIELRLGQALTPSVQLKRGGTVGPRELGGVLGHIVAGVKVFAGGLTVFQGAAAQIMAQGSEYKDINEMFTSFKEMESKLGGKHYKRVMRTMRRCVAIASQQPIEEMREFFAGLNKALAFGTITREGKLSGATTATEFYWILLLVGTHLKEFIKSMAQLHSACVLLWGQRAGDIKTTEKRCKRIGLSFARL